jgi:hypothetical protein
VPNGIECLPRRVAQLPDLSQAFQRLCIVSITGKDRLEVPLGVGELPSVQAVLGSNEGSLDPGLTEIAAKCARLVFLRIVGLFLGLPV